jgi:hypothetical protein
MRPITAVLEEWRIQAHPVDGSVTPQARFEQLRRMARRPRVTRPVVEPVRRPQLAAVAIRD